MHVLLKILYEAIDTWDWVLIPLQKTVFLDSVDRHYILDNEIGNRIRQSLMCFWISTIFDCLKHAWSVGYVDLSFPNDLTSLGSTASTDPLLSSNWMIDIKCIIMHLQNNLKTILYIAAAYMVTYPNVRNLVLTGRLATVCLLLHWHVCMEYAHYMQVNSDSHYISLVAIVA